MTNTVAQRIEESKVYLGGGSYSALQPVLTPAGRAAGWIYQYPAGISQNGVNFTRLGETLDSLEAAGFVVLTEQVVTCI